MTNKVIITLRQPIEIGAGRQKVLSARIVGYASVVERAGVYFWLAEKQGDPNGLIPFGNLLGVYPYKEVKE